MVIGLIYPGDFMAKRAPFHTQLDLFAAPGEAEPKPVVASAPVDASLTRVSQQLSASIYLGTSSWSFPGWRGLVYAADAPKTQLARHGLPAYARHPLLRAVGVDRTYYAPIAAADFADYADAVPDPFRFLVKAHELCTLPFFHASGRYAQRGGERNEQFLEPGYATDQVVAPCVEGLGAKAGPILFQFPPQPLQAIGGPERFAQRLHTFLDRLPHGPLYAVELRNAALFTAAYRAALADAGAVHCFNVHPSMPLIHEQWRLAGSAMGGALVVRWMLHPTQRYAAARDRYEPFNRLVDEDPDSRNTIAAMCLEAAAAGRPAIVIANNKAEGSSPLTVCKLAEHIVQEME
jgi:uncharacterized protein YecE (DUF72 family)